MPSLPQQMKLRYFCPYPPFPHPNWLPQQKLPEQGASLNRLLPSAEVIPTTRSHVLPEKWCFGGCRWEGALVSQCLPIIKNCRSQTNVQLASQKKNESPGARATKSLLRIGISPLSINGYHYCRYSPLSQGSPWSTKGFLSNVPFHSCSLTGVCECFQEEASSAALRHLPLEMGRGCAVCFWLSEITNVVLTHSLLY